MGRVVSFPSLADRGGRQPLHRLRQESEQPSPSAPLRDARRRRPLARRHSSASRRPCASGRWGCTSGRWGCASSRWGSASSRPPRASAGLLFFSRPPSAVGVRRVALPRRTRPRGHPLRRRPGVGCHRGSHRDVQLRRRPPPPPVQLPGRGRGGLPRTGLGPPVQPAAYDLLLVRRQRALVSSAPVLGETAAAPRTRGDGGSRRSPSCGFVRLWGFGSLRAQLEWLRSALQCHVSCGVRKNKSSLPCSLMVRRCKGSSVAVVSRSRQP